MPELEQSEGQAGQSPPLEAGALRQSPQFGDGQASGGAPHGEGMPPFRGQSQSATNLSLLADLDEPEELIEELWRIACVRGERSEVWKLISFRLTELKQRLAQLNLPKKPE